MPLNDAAPAAAGKATATATTTANTIFLISVSPSALGDDADSLQGLTAPKKLARSLEWVSHELRIFGLPTSNGPGRARAPEAGRFDRTYSGAASWCGLSTRRCMPGGMYVERPPTGGSTKPDTDARSAGRAAPRPVASEAC